MTTPLAGPPAPAAAPVLVVDAVHRAFAPSGGEPVPVLRGVDLALRPGELVTLAGPSGSGKSALLAIVARFDEPDAGSVVVTGSSSGVPPWSSLALVPQSLGLLDELTCEENAAAPILFAPGSGTADRAAGLALARELLDRLGVGPLARRYPGEISLGQQQRVAIARALVGRPAVLLADEPTAHLDHRTIEVVVSLLEDRVADGMACLLATHDPALVSRAHRRLELRHGKLTES